MQNCKIYAHSFGIMEMHFGHWNVGIQNLRAESSVITDFIKN